MVVDRLLEPLKRGWTGKWLMSTSLVALQFCSLLVQHFGGCRGVPLMLVVTSSRLLTDEGHVEFRWVDVPVHATLETFWRPDEINSLDRLIKTARKESEEASDYRYASSTPTVKSGPVNSDMQLSIQHIDV